MTLEPQQLSEEEFERRLLDSAQLDRLDEPDVAEAWSRFVLLTSSVGVSAESLSGLHRVREHNTEVGAAPERAGAAESPGTAGPGAIATGPFSAPATSLAERWVALKWGAFGTITGALLTGGVLWLAKPETHSTEPPGTIDRLAASQAPVSEAHVPSAPDLGLGAASAQAGGHRDVGPESAPESSHAQARIRLPKAVARPSGNSRSPSREPSSLAAEIQLVDDARRALLASDFSVAHELIQAYRHKFPKGVLTADVAYIEIKTAKAQRKDATWRSHANRFLVTFPRDPHYQQILELLNGTERSKVTRD